jgi:Fructose-2,6-bisphosphatase
VGNVPQFVFVRHGQSQANARMLVNDSASPLTDLGKQQARAVVRELIPLGITTIVCSPLTRARQTASIIAKGLGIDESDIHIIDELRERGFGAAEGKPIDRDPVLYYTDDDEGFEPCAELFSRMNRCIDHIKRLDSSGTVLIVGHSISGAYLIEAAASKGRNRILGKPFRIQNAKCVMFSL